MLCKGSIRAKLARRLRDIRTWYSELHCSKTKQGPQFSLRPFVSIGAGEEIRTLDPNLGKVMLYP
jgi:hypothetical protein